MPDVTIAYKNSTIASITGSGAVSLSTAGRYCEDNITVDYTKPTPTGVKYSWGPRGMTGQ